MDELFNHKTWKECDSFKSKIGDDLVKRTNGIKTLIPLLMKKLNWKKYCTLIKSLSVV
jgi:hypothetical protein